MHNISPRIIKGPKKFNHLRPVLKELRWVPITDHLYFPLVLLNVWSARIRTFEIISSRLELVSLGVPREFLNLQNILFYKSIAEHGELFITAYSLFGYRNTNLHNAILSSLSAAVVADLPRVACAWANIYWYPPQLGSRWTNFMPFTCITH